MTLIAAAVVNNWGRLKTARQERKQKSREAFTG